MLAGRQLCRCAHLQQPHQLPSVSTKRTTGTTVKSAARFFHRQALLSQCSATRNGFRHTAQRPFPFARKLCSGGLTVLPHSRGATDAGVSESTAKFSSRGAAEWKSGDSRARENGSFAKRLSAVTTRPFSKSSSCVYVSAGTEGRASSIGLRIGSRRAMTSISEQEFHELADETLEAIYDEVEGSLEDGFRGEYDCNMSQGVLNIVVTGRGTWVLNKQTPNRQIWWSSPISGPMRFEYDDGGRRWVNTRDGGTTLESLLVSELKDKCGVDVDFR